MWLLFEFYLSTDIDNIRERTILTHDLKRKLRIEITHYDFNTEFYFEIKSLCLQRK